MLEADYHLDLRRLYQAGDAAVHPASSDGEEAAISEMPSYPGSARSAVNLNASFRPLKQQDIFHIIWRIMDI